MLLAKAKKKGAASEKKAAKTGAAVRVQPASVAGAKAGAAAGEPGGGAEQAEQAHVQTAQTEQTDQSQGQSQSQTEARVAAAAGEEQQEVPAQDEEGMAELEERMKAWMKAVEEEVCSSLRCFRLRVIGGRQSRVCWLDTCDNGGGRVVLTWAGTGYIGGVRSPVLSWTMWYSPQQRCGVLSVCEWCASARGSRRMRWR